jgi:hypothetical protein
MTAAPKEPAVGERHQLARQRAKEGADPAAEPPTRGPAEFARQARALGLENVELRADGWVLFDLLVPAGGHGGEVVRVGAQVPPDFPDNPPPGPHVRPPYTHPAGGVQGSPLGSEFMYWSRPAQQWQKDRSVRAWVRHVRSLFGQT